ncbi:alpha-glucosidase [Bacteroides uniformis]|uniref:Alpha-glucosidase n=1 Tax=Bacteroides uniformis TaxID=820 RepID=A0A414BAF6_BACUN|nr:alpha-glucosidase [Bacteroides uniformis]
MKKIGLFLCTFVATTALGAVSDKELKLSSPNGNQTVVFRQEQVVPDTRELCYQVTYKGIPVVEKSRAGLGLDNRIWEMALGVRNLKQPACWMDNLEVDSVTTLPGVDNTWQPFYGERSTVRDNYNAATMHLSKKDGSGYRFDIEVRAYDEGVAFRYFFPEHPKAIFHKVVADLTEYTFPEGTMAWAEQWAQAHFEHLAIDDIKRPVERALTLELPGGVWAALTDADVDDWCLTKYLASDKKENTLTSVMYSPVDVVTYYATPWKIIMAADKPGELLEHNTIIENLNPPCEIADAAAWVKPGKIMRETTITTEGAIATIDFCAAHHIPYMLFDWLWYLPCTSHDGDATKVVDKLDMPRVVAYGKEKGVGIWVYVNQHALMKQARELFPILRQWGIVGVKSGFVQYASHRWATWLHDLVRLAAENHLMMNIHDEFRPSGFSRTYPNLLTQEGICGNEEFPDATHNTILPFTRMINGAADYTICYFDKRLKTTHAHQLAASLVFYSPLQTIFWYDKPSFYHGEPEVEWFENLQTVFDDTKVLNGTPGKNVTMARRKGQEWFLGAMTNNEGSREEIPLDFLDKNKVYLASVYTDGGEKVKTRTQVECSYLLVDASMTMKFDLKPSGGAAVRFVPVEAKEAKGLKKYKGKIL